MLRLIKEVSWNQAGNGRLCFSVEDHPDARAMYRGYLEAAGFDVVEAADGVEALLRVRDAVPDIVLMDLSMPLMDGWEATRSLKDDARTAGIPVVVLTGYPIGAIAEGGHERWLRCALDQALPAEGSRERNQEGARTQFRRSKSIEWRARGRPCWLRSVDCPKHSVRSPVFLNLTLPR